MDVGAWQATVHGVTQLFSSCLRSCAHWSPLCMVWSSLPGPPSIWVHVAPPSTDNTQPPVSCLFRPPSGPPSAFLPPELCPCCAPCLQRSVPRQLGQGSASSAGRESCRRPAGETGQLSPLLTIHPNHSLPWCWGRRKSSVLRCLHHGGTSATPTEEGGARGKVWKDDERGRGEKPRKTEGKE